MINKEKTTEEKNCLEFIEEQLRMHVRRNGLETKEQIVEALQANKRQWVATFIQLG
jgi:hypothetical protein